MTDQAPIKRSDAQQNGVRRTVGGALLVVLGMGALSFASVPLYDLFCRVTGFGGTTQRAEAASDTVLDRTVLIRFDASLGREMPWSFEPVQNEMQVRIGESNIAFYRAHNPTDRPVTGTASFNVAPYEVGSYFTKIECFCFTEQTLAPGESMDMPVTFFVEPDIVDDPENEKVKTITLSYTFFETEPSQAELSNTQADDGATKRALN
ncbi:MAG: cytochrome c oxidase assembly protein [Rhodobacteraceae bacterium]|nr:cytochrome c oxidase assembly protein [Paracoccaceae bacterium]